MNTFIFWFVQITWGLPLNIVGGLTALILMGMGYRPKKFGHAIYFETGNNWGGVNLGGFFIVQKEASFHIKRHEYGHCFQNMMLGFFMPIVVTIPSAMRYHYRNMKRAKGYDLPPYDAFWGEGWATRLGEKYFRK